MMRADDADAGPRMYFTETTEKAIECLPEVRRFLRDAHLVYIGPFQKGECGQAREIGVDDCSAVFV